MKKRCLAIVFCVILVLSMTACSSGGSRGSSSDSSDAKAPADVETMIVSHTSTADSTKGIFVETMAKWLEENTDDLRMEVYAAGQLGSDAENAESVVSGTIQMTLGATGNFINSIPELAIFDGPFAFDSYDQMTSAFADEEFLEALNSAIQSNGVAVIGLRVEGFRTLFSNKAVTSYEDLKGLQIRVMDSKNLINLWTALGATPTTVAYTELYTALQQGVVEAQENTSISTLTNYNLFEVTNTCTVTKHGFTNDPFIVNLEWYNGLTDQQRDELAEAFAYAQSTEPDPAVTEAETHQTFIDENGYKVYEFTDEDLEKCRAATQSVWDDIKASVSADLFNAYKTVIEKYK